MNCKNNTENTVYGNIWNTVTAPKASLSTWTFSLTYMPYPCAEKLQKHSSNLSLVPLCNQKR